MSERRPTYQNKRPKGEKDTKLAPISAYEPPLVRRLASMRINLPGAFGIVGDSRFIVEQRSFGSEGKGTSLTPIDKRQPRNGNCR